MHSTVKNMHYSAAHAESTIYETGLSDYAGRPHTYRHDRQRDAWVIGLGTQGSTVRTSGGTETVVATPGVGCSRPGTVYEIATQPPHNNRGIYALVKMPAGWEPAGFTEVQPGYLRVLLAGHPYLAEITDAFRAMYRWTRTFVPNAEKLALNALERGLLLAGATAAGSMTGGDDRLHGITGYIFERMDQPLDVPALAKETGLSPSRFAHLFTRVFGRPPMQYVEQVRMEEAKALLSSSSALVNSIARRVGYESEFYFSRRFKIYAGIAPSVYRKKRRFD